MSESALQKHIERAFQYLSQNHELREQLNISPDATLIPRPLGLGEHNLNYKFADPRTHTSYVLRINVIPQPFHKNQVAYEAGALRLLAPSMRTPIVYYVDSSRRWLNWDALVTGFCEGDELDFDNLQPGDLDAAAHIMADIHSVAIDDRHGASLYWPNDPLQDMYNEAISRFKTYLSSGYEEKRLTDWCQRLFDAVRKVMDSTAPATGRRAIINTETLPSHFLIARNQSSFGGDAASGSMIDWERPIIGEPAQDVAYFVSPTSTFWDSDYLFPATEVESFLHTYIDAVDKRFELGNFFERFYAYRAMTALRSATWCCRALAAYAKDSKSYKNPKTEGKLGIYLSDDFFEMLMRTCF